MNEVPLSMPTIFPVTCHTDFVGPGSVFVAIEGYADNGVRYICQAIEKGANTIVVHRDALLSDETIEYAKKQNVFFMRVDNTRKALALLSAEHAGFPAKKLKIIGITGTKGKTTTSFLLEHILATARQKTALISSARNRIIGQEFFSPLTTPQPDYLHQFLKVCVDNGVEYVVMEVAAQALSLYRVEGIEFDGVIFTNFSHEHLEFYPSMADYFDAKCMLFNKIKPSVPLVINGDDEHGRQLAKKHSPVCLYGFVNQGLNNRGMFVADPIHEIQLRIMYKDICDIVCPVLFGAYNGYNVLAAVTMALQLHIPISVIQHALMTFSGIPGRLQQSKLSNGARVFIDYAHNPDSFKAVLTALRLLTDHLIVVFGAGGGRDKSKRPLMGDVAVRMADAILLTSDNPRLEDPITIIDDIKAGIAEEFMHKVHIVVDRKEAIECGYKMSKAGSIIALLGKGPDEYQMIGTTKYYFSEQMIIKKLGVTLL